MITKMLVVLGLLLPSVMGAASASSKCDAFQTELDILDFKIMQSDQRLSEVEKLLETAQKHLDDISNAMAAVLSGSKYSTMDSMVLIRYCKEAIGPAGSINATQAIPCVNRTLDKMIDSKRSVAKTLGEVRAENQGLRRQLFMLREKQAAAGCATDSPTAAPDTTLPPRDTSTLCAEKWAGLRAIRVRLQGIREEYDWQTAELDLHEKSVDQLTAEAAVVLSGNGHEKIRSNRSSPCAEYFERRQPPAKVVACYNEYVGRYLDEARKLRKVLQSLRDKDQEARREAATIRDIAAEMRCPEPPPLNVKPLPELAPLKEPKPMGAPAAPAESPLPTLSQPGAISQGDTAAFIGKWTGTVTITAASEPGMVGISETATLELFAAGTGIGVKGRLGVIGNPAAYQIKVTGNRLQIHYTGPSHTTATPGIPATIDYSLDVTRSGNQLSGEARTRSTSSYGGQTAVVSFTQKMALTL